jgi:hypothetical protein
MKAIKNLIILCLLFPVSCMSKSDIISLGEDNYVISGSRRVLIAGEGNLTADLIEDATKFCTKQNKKLVLKSSDATAKDRAFNQDSRRAEVFFLCVEDNAQKVTPQ